jgi:hypothetical protein
MKCYVMLCLCMLFICYEGGLDNLIEKPSMMGLRTGIHWRRMKGFIHLPHSY